MIESLDIYDEADDNQLSDMLLAFEAEMAKPEAPEVAADIQKAIDAILADQVTKAYQRKFSTKTEAAQHAARARWGNRGSSSGTSDKELATLEADYGSAKQAIDSIYPDDPESWLSEDELWAVSDYTAGSSYLNNGLREGTLDRDEWDTVDLIDSALEKAPALPKAIVVHRGIDSGTPSAVVAQLTKLKVGESFDEDGYCSTSINSSVGRRFASRVLLEIALPAGTKRALATSKAGAKGFGFGESEMLLDRGLRLKVLAKRSDGDLTILRVTPKEVGVTNG